MLELLGELGIRLLVGVLPPLRGRSSRPAQMNFRFSPRYPYAVRHGGSDAARYHLPQRAAAIGRGCCLRLPSSVRRPARFLAARIGAAFGVARPPFVRRCGLLSRAGAGAALEIVSHLRTRQIRFSLSSLWARCLPFRCAYP
jgi:hypothetical protein